MPPDRAGPRLAAEFLGALLLAAAVIGSGVMAERLADGNAAVALLANTGATVCMLAVLIMILAPVSGAHFNPAVTMVQWIRGHLPRHMAVAYVVAQIAGCSSGALLAHAMFGLPLVQLSGHARTGPGIWLSEVVATAGLVIVVLGARSVRDAAWLVAAWIGAAYWFTASTSFANPAITIARALTDTFSGIRPADAPLFIVMQILGAVLGLLVARWLTIEPAGRDARAGAATG